MKRIYVRILTILGVLVGILFIVAIIAGMLLNSPSMQNKLLSRATQLLSEKLQTRVVIDSIHIGFFSDKIRLYRMEVEDLQQRKMLQIDYLTAEISMMSLLHREINIKEINVRGMKAQLFKPSLDSAANYQFVLDAFKPTKKKEEEKKEKSDSKTSLAFNLNKVTLHQINMAYHHATKNGQQTTQLAAENIMYKHRRKVEVDSLHLKIDNHLPPKYVDKPNRGKFDTGHLDIVANLKATIRHANKDYVQGSLTECNVKDVASGLNITDLRCEFKQEKEWLHLNEVAIALPHTTLAFKEAEIQLPSKKQGKPFLFRTSDITGNILLADISQPFAPVLKNFKQPLTLNTKFSGTDSTLIFQDVFVKTPDNKLQVKASGSIKGLKGKDNQNIHFDVQDMRTPVSTVEHIINQFSVKKFMIKQLRALHTIHYVGSFDVKGKREEFRGDIGTAYGNIHFSLALDGKNDYLNGNVQTKAFQLGKVMDFPDIGNVACRAGFQIDISKQRTARMRRQKGGKLPIGHVDASIHEASYKSVKVTDIEANIVSDGAIAEGKLKKLGSFAHLLCSFSFTNTDEMQKTKIKPSIHFNIFNKKDQQNKKTKKEKKDKKEKVKKEKKDKKKKKEKKDKK